MARDLEGALGPSLNAPPVPDSGPALVDYAGGRAALVRQMTGMDHAPRRGEYSDAEAFEAARTRWRTAQRNAQRWDKGRHPSRESLTPATKGRLRREANRRRRAELERRGLRARMKVRLRVPSPNARRGDDVRTRELPVYPAPAVLIDGGTVAEILEELAEQDRDAAAEDFLEAFMDAYGMPEGIDAEVDEVLWLRVWPDGEPEPRGA